MAGFLTPYAAGIPATLTRPQVLVGGLAGRPLAYMAPMPQPSPVIPASVVSRPQPMLYAEAPTITSPVVAASRATYGSAPLPYVQPISIGLGSLPFSSIPSSDLVIDATLDVIGGGSGSSSRAITSPRVSAAATMDEPSSVSVPWGLMLIVAIIVWALFQD